LLRDGPVVAIAATASASCSAACSGRSSSLLLRGLHRSIEQPAAAHGDQPRPAAGARGRQRPLAPLERRVEVAQRDETLGGVRRADDGLPHLAAALRQHVGLQVVLDRIADAIHLRGDRRLRRLDPGAHAVAAVVARPQVFGQAAGGLGCIHEGGLRPAPGLRGLQAHRIRTLLIVRDGVGHGLVAGGHPTLVVEDRRAQPGCVAAADGAGASREAGPGLVAPVARCVVVGMQQRDLAFDEAQAREMLARGRVRAGHRDQAPGLGAEFACAAAVDLAQMPRQLDAKCQPRVAFRRRQAGFDLPQFRDGSKLADKPWLHSGFHILISARTRPT
jgi:hypothetical protein